MVFSLVLSLLHLFDESDEPVEVERTPPEGVDIVVYARKKQKIPHALAYMDKFL